MELCKCDLNCIGDIKTLEVPEPWDVYHGELLTGNGTSPRGKWIAVSRAGRAEPSKLFDIRPGASGSEFCPIAFSLTFIQYFHTVSLFSLSEWQYALYIGSMSFAFDFPGRYR